MMRQKKSGKVKSKVLHQMTLLGSTVSWVISTMIRPCMKRLGRFPTDAMLELNVHSDDCIWERANSSKLRKHILTDTAAVEGEDGVRLHVARLVPSKYAKKGEDDRNTAEDDRD